MWPPDTPPIALQQSRSGSHSIWFHQPFDVSEWLRMEIRGERLAGGRGFGTGAVYAESGSLVASFAQESVIRPFA
jgi:acyl-CoA thioesterase-2